MKIQIIKIYTSKRWIIDPPVVKNKKLVFSWQEQVFKIMFGQFLGLLWGFCVEKVTISHKAPILLRGCIRCFLVGIFLVSLILFCLGREIISGGYALQITSTPFLAIFRKKNGGSFCKLNCPKLSIFWHNIVFHTLFLFTAELSHFWETKIQKQICFCKNSKKKKKWN